MNSTKDLIDNLVNYLKSNFRYIEKASTLFFIDPTCLGIVDESNAFLGVISRDNDGFYRLSINGMESRYNVNYDFTCIEDIITKLQIELMYHLHVSTICHISPTYNTNLKLEPK